MLSEESARRSLLHLTTMGDTDIFPAPFEFHFYREKSDKVIEAATKLNFGDYLPRGCVELLSPKGSLSFRIAHQLYPADTVIYTAAAIEVAEKIETIRRPIGCGPFSYRFVPEAVNPRLFAISSGYHDWIEHLQEMYENVSGFGKNKHRVIETDISDFTQEFIFTG
jgi:hypothetical protein